MDNKSQILSSIKDVVIKIDDQVEVLLFGSRARGDEKEDSDWDVLILTEILVDEKFKWMLRSKLLILELKYDICIGSLIFNKKSWTQMNGTPLYQEIEKRFVTI